MVEIIAAATRLGIERSEVVAHLCFEVPDTPWGWAYQTFIQRTNITGAIGVMVSSAEDFAAGGPDRLTEFNRSMVLNGRPCHFAMAIGAYQR